MKINYCIEENFKDYFDLAIQYWMYAKSHSKEIEYKKSILFLGFSTELTVLMLVRNKANKPIYQKLRIVGKVVF